MEAKPLTDCVVCGKSPAGGRWQKSGEDHTAVPVCEACFESGAFERWFRAAEAEIIAFGQKYAMTSDSYTGNIARDLQMVRAHLKHEANIEDGVCPNGCARMTQIDAGDYQCPVCNFTLHKRTL